MFTFQARPEITRSLQRGGFRFHILWSCDACCGEFTGCCSCSPEYKRTCTECRQRTLFVVLFRCKDFSIKIQYIIEDFGKMPRPPVGHWIGYHLHNKRIAVFGKITFHDFEQDFPVNHTRIKDHPARMSSIVKPGLSTPF